ncbi:hypothetical protein NQ315_005077 [Exocentrus adspersus]|uniref:ADAMTS/ADAMTS-like Spacer 1 domain-containing protein n=1 Tax=Exocentrus adspersus TaxID=1586481 RepID=A0AAV8VQY4_9CUCU|nr:hypothetical protein NQ315_005077 [Exocentrus adspersus]
MKFANDKTIIWILQKILDIFHVLCPIPIFNSFGDIDVALKISNGSYIMNGDWKFSNSRVFQGAGTKFIYVRQDDNSLETITSLGPLANSVDIMVVNYQMNPGIKYGYSVPLDQTPVLAPPFIKKPAVTLEPATVETRRLDLPLYNISYNQKDEARPPPVHPGPRRTRVRRKYFHWKITGLTACSKSCGGGIQTYVKTCYREIHPHNQVPVSDKRCAHLDTPASAPIQCNIEPCAPNWEGYWTDCSVTCGDGIQRYILQCKQEMTSGSIIVSDEQCPTPKPSSQTRTCREAACEINDNELPQNVDSSRVNKEWSVGSWSECSVSCGTGHKTRQVTCPSSQCRIEDRPAHAEYCNVGPCAASSTNYPSSTNTLSFSSWLVTDWSQCSEPCGTGIQSRLAVCGLQNQDTCSSESKPELSRACSSEKQCGGQWFTGPWGSCSESCNGRSKQKRDVFCIVKIRGQSHITNDMTCSSQSKPYEEQACDGVCPPHWFIGDWGQCEGGCPVGVQRREVKCLDHHGRAANGCTESDMPVSKRTCACDGNNSDQRERYKPAQDEPIDRK